MTAPIFDIDLPLREDWDAVEAMRSTVSSCLAVVYDSRDYSETVAMIVAELVENAVKYGAWGPGVTGRLKVTGREFEVEVVVINRLRDEGDAARLRQVLSDLDSASLPAESYIGRLRQAAVAPGPSGGLGLARISYEGNCRISAHFIGDGTVAVHARVGQSEAVNAATA